MPSAPSTGDGSSSADDSSARVPPTAFTLDLNAVTYTYSSAHSFPVRPVVSPSPSSSSSGSIPVHAPVPPAATKLPSASVLPGPFEPTRPGSAPEHPTTLATGHGSLSQGHLAPLGARDRNSSSASSSSSRANAHSFRSARSITRPHSHNEHSVCTEQTINRPHRSHRHRIVAGVGAAQEALRKEADRLGASPHAHHSSTPSSDLRASSSLVDVHRDLRYVPRGVRTRPRSPTNRSVRSVASAPGMFPSDSHWARATIHPAHSLHASSSPDETEAAVQRPDARYRSNTQPVHLIQPVSLAPGMRRRRTPTHESRSTSSPSGTTQPMSAGVSGSGTLPTVPPSEAASELVSPSLPPPPYSPPRSGSPASVAATSSRVNGLGSPPEDSTENELSPVPIPDPEEADLEDETVDEVVNSADGDDEGDVLVHIFVLHPLRLLASVPGLLGTLYLWRKCVMVALRNQDLRRVGDRSLPGALDYFTASGWVSDLPISSCRAPY